MSKSKVRMKWRRGAFRDLRTMPGVRQEVDRRAASVASAADSGGGTHYVRSSVSGGKGRYRAAVIAGDREARLASSRHSNLLRSLDAGRG